MFATRTLGILSILATLLLTSGCGGGDQAENRAGTSDDAATSSPPTQGGTIIRRLGSDLKTLNWVLHTTVHENYVMRNLYDPLVEVGENLDYVPVLAEGWKVSDDRLRITVTLREGLVWHDGKPITSEDVKFTMDAIKDPAIPALNKEGYFTKLDRIEVVDERTFTFVWREAYAPSIYAITQITPIPKHVYGQGDFLTHPANRRPVGSGPFEFSEWRSNQFIRLVRAENYWGKPAYLDEVIFKIIEDDAVALNALKAGDIDEMRISQEQWETQTGSAEFERAFEKHSYYVPSYNYIGWNCRSNWFKDYRVRQAMTHLFDRESIRAKIYYGKARLVSGPFYVNSTAYDPTVKPLVFSPDIAKELLTAAGWEDRDQSGVREKDGVEFEFEMIITAGSSFSQRFALLLQEECRKAGVTMRIRPLEGATFFDRVDKGEFDACMLSWRLDLDPDIYDTFHSSQVPPKGINHVFYSNASVDSLLEAGRVEFDPDQRRHIYNQVHRLINKDQPYTFINTVPEKRPINRRIKGVVISPMGPYYFYPGSNYWYIAPPASN